jgi:hypothetical protein
MKELGLFGATIGEEYGGLGLSAWTYAQIVIKVAGAWMAPSGIFNSHLIVASAIERNGTDEQKQKYLPRMATGELRGSIGLTEPNAGSDLQAIRTTAKLDGDDYVVNGSKMWITNSMYGHFTLLLVKTDPDAQPRHKGMSLLIAEKGPGYNVNKLKKMGYRSIDTCEINFDNYRVSKDNLLGGVEGKGFIQTAGGLELGRINVAARGHRDRRGRSEAFASLCTGAQRLWKTDLATPGRADEVGRHGDAGRRGEAVDRAGGAQIRPRRALRSRSRDGEACGLGGRRVLRTGRHAHLRWLQLFGRIRHRALLP